MKLLGLEAVQCTNYYLSRYRQVEELGADLFVLNGTGDPGFWPAGRYRLAGSKHLDDLIAAAAAWHGAERFDGVFTFSESSVIAAAAVAEALGLPGVGVAAARTSRNKLLMRQAHERAGVPHPAFRMVPDLDAALAAASDFGYPVILKPTLGAGSNFVFRIDGPDDMRLRFPQAAAGIDRMGWYTMEPDGEDRGPHGLLVESFLDGPEFLTESLIWDDEVFVGSIVDRVTVEGDTFDDDVHHAPTALDETQVEQVRDVIAAAARAQGLKRSVLHAEVRFHEGRPNILEIAVRPGGGGLDYFARLSADYCPIRTLIDVTRGVRPDARHYRPTSVHTAGTCLISEPGRVERITVPRSVSESDRVFFLKITAEPGDVIRRPPHGNNILGFLCTTGTSFDDAMRAATDFADRIEVRMAPAEPGIETGRSAAPSPRDEAPVRGGRVRWAVNPGFPPSTIFPFTPPERIGQRNLPEFQNLMYRPLYWLGKDGHAGIDFDLSLAEPPEWSEDGRTVTVTMKPWKWSNGETICADNVMFFVNMMKVKPTRYGYYTPGFLPDNLESYQKVAEDKVQFTFDRVYSKTWVLMNQLTIIIPMPKAWDRTGPDSAANASADLADIPAVYDYLVSENGEWTDESNEHRTRWPSSPVWSVVNGPWRLREFTLDAEVVFVPNEHYSGPNKPYLDEFRLVSVDSDEDEYALLRQGPDAPGALQVGFLPHGLDTGAAPGENPLAEHYRLVPQNIYMIHYMPVNFANPTTAGRILAQTYIRQALQCTVDQESAIRDVFRGYGYRTTGPVPMVPDSDLVSPARRADPMAFDLERARGLLERHGWDVSTTPAVCVRPGAGPGCAGEGIEAGDRLSLTLRYIAGRVSLTRTVRQLVADAAKAGIELRAQELFGSVLVGEDHTEAAPDNPHLWQLQYWNGGWAFVGHPTGEVLFKTGAGSNFGHYSDPRADELIDRTVTTDDPNALFDYQDYLAEQVPVIWMPGFSLRVFAVAHTLRGFEPLNPYGILTPENWYYTG